MKKFKQQDILLLYLEFILSTILKPAGELVFSFHISLNKSESAWRYD